jgi:ABC-type multidrug transport system fused ATPase/permease subunit
VIAICLMLTSSLAEIVGVVSVAPFIGYAATGVIANASVRALVASVPNVNPLVTLGTFSFVALLVSNILLAATTFAIMRLTRQVGETLSSRIFENLIRRPYSAFLASNSSEQLTGLLRNVDSAVGNVLLPLLATVSRVLSLLAILVLLVFINPAVAILAFAIAGLSYVGAFRLLAPRIAVHGTRSYKQRTRMYQLAAEAFEAIREVKAFAGEAYFASRFARMSHVSAEADAVSQMMRQLPRYLIETVAFGGMIAVVIVLAWTLDDPKAVWPLLALYAVAAWRLLPAAQQIFANVTSIRHHWPALESVNASLGPGAVATDGLRKKSPPPHVEVPETAAPERAGAVAFRHVTFAYAGALKPVLDRFELTVEVGDVVAITGRSGAGKSTLLALALGLLEPTSGEVLVGGRPAAAALCRRRIAYVPQHPALQDDSVRRNVAFSLDDRAIDEARVERAVAAVGLGPVVAALPSGLDSRIGERGQGLSGGQRQRLALARALYLEPELLVLDEFTSALDAATEREILDTLVPLLRGRTALIVTHRTEVLRLCSRVVELG